MFVKTCIILWVAAGNSTYESPIRVRKRSQLFIHAHNETLIAAPQSMCIGNDDCSPARINGRDTDPTPTALRRAVAALRGGWAKAKRMVGLED